MKELLTCSRVTFDGDDELRENGEEFVGTFFDKFVSALTGQKFIRFFGLPEPLEENGKVKMIVEMFGLHFPCELTNLSSTLRRAPWKLTATGKSPRS